MSKIGQLGNLLRVGKIFGPSTSWRQRLPAILTACLVVAVGVALVPRPKANSPKPTGTYTDWSWPGSNYNSFDWIVTAGIDQSGPDAYFYSHQFGLVNGNGGYSGLQGDYNGKRAIFSLWDTLAARGPEIARPFGGEGTGYQTIINYPWVAGRGYAFHVQREAADATGVWWSSSVKDTVTGIVSPIGQIKVPSSWGGLNGYSVVWTERYGGQMVTCQDIYHSVVTFTDFSANNGSVRPASSYNHLANPIECPGSQITDIRGGVRHEMGVGNDLPPVKAAGEGLGLSDLKASYVSNGYGPLKYDKSTDDHLLTLNGQRYARGLGSHANADIRYDLAGQYANFYANVGVDDEVSNAGSVTFQVWLDGAKVFDSGNMTGGTPTKTVSVDTRNAKELKLIVTDSGDGNGYDHSDWADARLIKSASPPPTSPPPTSPPPTSPPPTSPPPTSPPPTKLPTVQITTPSNGSQVYNGTYVSAMASGPAPITKMEIYIDGELKTTSNKNSINYTWISYYATKGQHSITATAYDNAGQIGQTAITVYK